METVTVLVEDVADPSDAIRVAQRIQSSFTRPFLLEGHEVFKSASIGIALTSPEISAEGVLQNADIAMYRAKEQGKACSELFDRTMHEQVMSRLLLEDKLRYALQNEELALHYQPIVAVETGAIEGFEALLRWQPAGSNAIPPSTFVPIAEQCGLIVPISVWALKTGLFSGSELATALCCRPAAIRRCQCQLKAFFARRFYRTCERCTRRETCSGSTMRHDRTHREPGDERRCGD